MADFEENIRVLNCVAGKAMGSAVPSTMGALMASGLINAGKELRGVEVMKDLLWARFFQAYWDEVQARGKARPGEKTFLDGLYPVVALLHKSQGDVTGAAPLAAQAAQEGFQSTKGMLAKHGRTAIRGEESRDHLDPGAAVAALLMQGFAQIAASY